MFKLLRLFVVVVICAMVFSGGVLAQNEEENIVTGKVEQIAEDGSYLILDGVKFMISDEIRETLIIEADDEVELTIEDIDGVQFVVDYNYLNS